MSVRAKFKVTKIERSKGGRYVDGKYEACEVQTIVLYPVSGGSEENKRFFNATPSGEIRLATVNADAVAEFDLDKEYYVDFTPAE